jgi:surface antigen
MFVDDSETQGVDRSVTGTTAPHISRATHLRATRLTAGQQAINAGVKDVETGKQQVVAKTTEMATGSKHMTSARMPVVIPGAESKHTTSMRMPVVIPGAATAKKDSAKPTAASPRRFIVHAGVAALLLVVVVGALAAVLPTQSGSAGGMGQLFQPSMQSVSVKNNPTALIASQAATATAVTHDGYEYNGAGGQYSWTGVQKSFTLPNGTSTSSIPSSPVTPTPSAQTSTSPSGPTSISTGGGLSSPSTGVLNTDFYDPFTAGQCTYWADYEYHRLTGNVVTWSGNADTWASGAATAGWTVSSTPHLYSIIVLQGGVQGAGVGTGHVAVVEKINADGSVATTSWNVVGWGVFSWGTYRPGPGVSFIWH